MTLLHSEAPLCSDSSGLFIDGNVAQSWGSRTATSIRLMNLSSASTPTPSAASSCCSVPPPTVPISATLLDAEHPTSRAADIAMDKHCPRVPLSRHCSRLGSRCPEQGCLRSFCRLGLADTAAAADFRCRAVLNPCRYCDRNGPVGLRQTAWASIATKPGVERDRSSIDGGGAVCCPAAVEWTASAVTSGVA